MSMINSDKKGGDLFPKFPASTEKNFVCLFV